MKDTCRFCAEPVDADADRCPHCGEALRETAQAAAPAPAKSSAMLVVIVVAVCVLGLFCFIGMVAAIAVPNLIDARKRGNEAAAIGALKTITTAQSLFREADKDGDQVLDYGDLQELSDTSLIDPVLGSGMKQGYTFQVVPAPSTPELLWMATAAPLQPGTTGERYFMVNHEGVVLESTSPFTITDDCATPAGAAPARWR